MGILLWIIVGIALGSAARWVMPGPPAGGLSVAIPLAIGGAILGGLAGVWLTGSATGFDFRSTLLAIIGSLFVSFSYRAYAMRAAA